MEAAYRELFKAASALVAEEEVSVVGTALSAAIDRIKGENRRDEEGP